MKNLFSSTKIGHLTLDSRVVIPPMVCREYGLDDGTVTDRHAAHYEALAEGKPGLIIQEAACISPTARLHPLQIGIWSDDHLPGLSRIVDIAHSQGIPIIAQLQHSGLVSQTGPPVTASPYTLTQPDGSTVEGQELTLAEIEQVKADFVAAGIRARRAGYDGIELHGCHGYLLSQFLNRDLNHRSDAYGENPAKLLLDILSALRQALPAGFIIGVRLGGFEPTLTDGIANAQLLAQHGVDYLHISYGLRPVPNPPIPEDYPFSAPIYAAAQIAEAVDIPVIGVFGINSRSTAQQILTETAISMVALGRASLVNPNWTADARAGRDTGRCLYCKACFWRIEIARCPGRRLYLSKAAKE